MTRQQPIELFMPPNMLKAKVGGGLGGIDMAAIKRAEAAMEDAEERIRRLDGRRCADADRRPRPLCRSRRMPTAAPRCCAPPMTSRARPPTFNYPLIARVAGSLSRMIGELPHSTALPLA